MGNRKSKSGKKMASGAAAASAAAENLAETPTPMPLQSAVELGGLPGVELRDPASGARVRVSLFGGTVYSFVDGSGQERLFLSASSKLDESKPIRGGVPLVFPQFGAGPLPNHGFARTSQWALKSGPGAGADGLVTAVFALASSDATRVAWPHDFELEHTVSFDATRLRTRLAVRNVGAASFDFQMLLHTYYAIEGGIEGAGVAGLKGLSYIDQLQDGKVLVEDNDTLGFPAETDSIYKAAGPGPVEVALVDAGAKRKATIKVELAKDGEPQTPDVVVWNPWVAKAAKMGDFGDQEFNNMVCVEPGCMSRFEACLPGATWTLQQSIVFE